MPSYTETVPAQDGKLEDKIVFGTIALILLGAALLMYTLYPPQANDFKTIPKPIRAAITQLSIASEELLLLKELEGKLPTIDSLKAMGIAPFTESNLTSSLQFDWARRADCFIGQTRIKQASYQIRLTLPNTETNQTPMLDWRQTKDNGASLEGGCQPEAKDWRSAMVNQNIQKDLHVH